MGTCHPCDVAHMRCNRRASLAIEHSDHLQFVLLHLCSGCTCDNLQTLAWHALACISQQAVGCACGKHERLQIRRINGRGALGDSTNHTTVVGATVLGATVLGATVLGATVVGATVLGATVLGGSIKFAQSTVKRIADSTFLGGGAYQ